ncbi:MAG: ABC transporter permease, partial [Muribaculaceae bacterium]|nr:ABC transporter permease [Muribaculaceae bacterium]
SRYNVSASVDFGGRSMSTYLFFESIPDEFFDVKPDGWDSDLNSPSYQIPIILSKDYLALYNFGFAASRGMPQISENLISKIPLRVSLSGNGHQEYMPARIVGFSSRLNTIAVPSSFMKWANDRYGDPDDPGNISRLIVEVNDPGNPAIAKYLEERGIEVAGDKLNQGKTAYFISIMSFVVIAIGAVISVLSFFILMLSIYLLLQKNKEKINALMMLGYTPAQAGSPYYKLVAIVNIAILTLSCLSMVIASSFWAKPFEELGLSTVSPLPTI